MMPDELKGVMTCPDCTGYRERMFAWEQKYWRLSALMVVCIGPRAQQSLPGAQGKTWADAYTELTGVDWATAKARSEAAFTAKQKGGR